MMECSTMECTGRPKKGLERGWVNKRSSLKQKQFISNILDPNNDNKLRMSVYRKANYSTEESSTTDPI
jgi:hypothetical protein